MTNWDEKLSGLRLHNSSELLQKSKYKFETPDRAPRSYTENPLDLRTQLGYKDRRYSATFDILKRIPGQLGIIAAIIQTRCNQVATFAVPHRENKGIGFRITPKAKEKITTKGQLEFIRTAEEFIRNCGHVKHNKFSNIERDTFEVFLKKFVRDSLTLDQSCSVAGTLIELADGSLCKVEDLEAGMEVVTHTGKVQKILYPTSREFSGQLVTIKIGGESITVTDTHPVLAAKRTSSLGNKVELSTPEWTSAGDLTTSHYVVYPRHVSERITFKLPIFNEPPRKYPTGDIAAFSASIGVHPKTCHQILTGIYKKNGPMKTLVLQKAKELGISYIYRGKVESETEIDEDFAFFLGLCVANGSVNKNVVQLTFHSKDDHLVEFCKMFGNKHLVHVGVFPYENRKATNVVFSCARLSSFVLKSVGKLSHNKQVPSFIFDCTEPVILAFMRGYLACDGSVTNHGFDFSTTSARLFSGIRRLASLFGCHITRCITKQPKSEWRDLHNGSINGDLADLLNTKVTAHRSYLCDTSYVYRKITELNNNNIDSIRVYNCEVEEDHSYIASGFINHNCFEIVPDKKGRPYEFIAVDAASIRIASPFLEDLTGNKRSFSNLIDPSNLNGEDSYTTLDPNAPFMDRPAYVQVVDGKVVNVYSRNELGFCIRNPRTDLLVQGYGQSELEMMINIITAHLNAETHNSIFFRQGSNAKGILNLKGDSMSPEHIEAFSRMWRDTMEGVQNFHRIPILQNEAGIEWISTQMSNKDMEYGQWLEYCTKIATAVYQIDPAELNFDMQGGVQQTPLFESSSEWKLKASRDKGLRPLLRFVADSINRHVMAKMDEDFVFEFVGLDEPTEIDKHNLRKEQASTYLTLNEVRVAEDRPPLPYGDVPLNPVYVQIMAMQKEQQAAQQQQPAGQEPPQQDGQQPQQQGATTDESNEHIPSYAESFGQK